MDFVNIKIENKYNKYSEPTESLVIRETNTTRMLFFPTLSIDDSGVGNVSGSLIFEKKGPCETWERDKTFQLSKLSSGEWTKIDLKKEEINLLIEYSRVFKDIMTKDGIPTWINNYILISKSPFDKIDDINLDRIKKFIKDHLNDVDVFDDFDKYVDIIRKLSVRKEVRSIDLLLEKIAEAKLSNEDLSRLTNALDSDMLSFVDYNLNIRKLQTAISFLESNLESKDEELFQKFFENNPFIFQMIFPSLLHFLKGVRYMGGKNAKNQKGIFTDLVFSNKMNNVCIIELKTPKTNLVCDSKYRENFEVHKDLIGSIIQGKKQKSTLMRNYKGIKDDTELEGLSTLIDPNILILIGNKSELSFQQIETFDYLRASMKDVTIITYDELIERFKLILENLK
jgi:hypothetical protein